MYTNIKLNQLNKLINSFNKNLLIILNLFLKYNNTLINFHLLK